MPLSDHEQKVLKEIESALYAEDPKFFMYVAKAKGGILTAFSRRKTVILMTLALGLVLLVSGIFLLKIAGIPIFSILGFLIILFGGYLLINSPKSAPSHNLHAGSSGIAKKMEQRFRKRFP